MLKETRILNELGSLYEAVNKTHTLDSKVNFILEKNSLSHYSKSNLKDIVKQVVYNEQASNEEKSACLDKYIDAINSNILTEQRSEEILNEFLGRLKQMAQGAYDSVRSAGQTVGSAFNRTGTGIVSSAAQSFANRLERIAKAIETLQRECTAAGPGNIPITKLWAQLKSDPAGSGSTGMDRDNMPSGEFFKLMGSDERVRDERIKRFMRAISQTLPSLVSDKGNPFITIGNELRTIAWNRKTRGPGVPKPGEPPEAAPETAPEAAPPVPPSPTPVPPKKKSTPLLPRKSPLGNRR